MNIAEKDLQNFLWNKSCIEVNGQKVFLIGREIDIGNGRMDIVGKGEDCKLYIFELKAGEIDSKAFAQLSDYMNFMKIGLGKKDLTNQDVVGVLIGRSISKRAKSLVIASCGNVVFCEYQCNMTLFDRNWQFTNAFFETIEKQTNKIINLFKNSNPKSEL